MTLEPSHDSRAHLLRGAFYLLLLLAVCVIPFALAQQVTIMRSVPQPGAPAMAQSQLPGVSAPQLPHDLRAVPELPGSEFPNSTSGATGSCNAIQNGGFESGSFAPWVIDGHNNDPVVSNANPHTGTFSAFLGSFPATCGNGSEANGNSSFYQQFTVPAGGGTLSFWHWDCTSDSITFDWQDAYITDTKGNTLQIIFHQCNNTEAWINTQVAMAPYAGQTVRIKFLVHGEGFGDLTSMYVDDVSLPIANCTPSPTPTPTATATPTPTATASPCDVIVNGGFETGSFPPWVIDGNNATPVVTNTKSHSGIFSAFAGDAPDGFCGPAGHEPNGNSSFYQQFTLPAGVSTLSFWHWDCTTDTITFDWQDAYITDTKGNIMQIIFHQCNNTQAWVNTQVDMAPYAGRTVRIKFLVHEDMLGDLTGMYVDDVALLCGAPSPTPTATPTPCPQTVITGSITNGDPIQLDRVFRSGSASTCGAPGSCSILTAGAIHYNAYTFTNTAGSTQCVTVDLNTSCIGTNNIFTVAYLGSFDPNNICTNYLADEGLSPTPENQFSFNLDNGQTVVLVVSEVTSGAGCPSYTMTVSGVCISGTPTPTPPLTPTATPTPTPRPTSTPRRRPTPYPRPTP